MPSATDLSDVEYHGPPRKPEDVIAAALADEEFMAQIAGGLEEERRGVPPVPLREIRAGLREKDARRRRTA
jgi:hypothetical protein